jgi:hypothetical protein
MNIDDKTKSALSYLSPLQDKLTKIMKDKYNSVSRMPFSIVRYAPNDYLIHSENGAISYSSEFNTYFDSSFYAMTKVIRDCLKIISFIDCPDDPMYQYLRKGISELHEDDNLIVPTFELRDLDIDEKTSSSHSYISNSLNISKGDCKIEDVYNVITISNIFKAFTLVIDKNRPFMQGVLSEHDNYDRLMLMCHIETIKSILDVFTTTSDLDFDDLFHNS